MIRILLGGSPCTHWSIAQSKNRETEPSGEGWELFKNYLIAKEKFRPDIFLYENNKSAAPAIKNQISKELGVDLMYINSALVSAQNRQRFYCFNWTVEQPDDRGILLADVLESGLVDREKSYCLKHQAGNVRDYFKKHHTQIAFEPLRIGTIENEAKNQQHDSQQYRVYSPYGKSVTLCGNGGGLGAKTGLYAIPVNTTSDGKAQTIKAQYGKTSIANICCYQSTYGASGVAEPVIFNVPHGYNKGGIKYGKSPTLTANGDWQHNNFVIEAFDGKTYPVYEVKGGLITIKDKQYEIKLPDGYYIIRKLTPIECERLQTLPDNYTAGISNTQRYKCLGNGWTAEVIIHILRGALRHIPRDEGIEVLSMYDGIATGRYCLDKLGFNNVRYYAYEIDKYAKQVAMNNYTDVIQCGDAFRVRDDDWGHAVMNNPVNCS